MNNFLSEIKEIVNAINNSPKDKRYFLSGGCSNLANYFTPTFLEKEGKIEFALFIFAEEEWDVEQINKIMNRSNKEKLNKLNLSNPTFLQKLNHKWKKQQDAESLEKRRYREFMIAAAHVLKS